MWYPIIRRGLFCFEPEQSHRLAMRLLHIVVALGWRQSCQGKPVRLLGLSFPNGVGLAAGFDKDGDYLNILAKLGFGFIEVGTVTPKPQPGNPKPRLFRIPEREALINRFGFNSLGVDHMVENLQRRRYKGVLGVNIGKNATTPIENALDDYLICLRKVYPYADYIVVNVSSPNTKNLRELQQPGQLEHLLAGIQTEQENLATLQGRQVPILLKVAPDIEQIHIETIATLLKKYGIDGLIVSNTTILRDGYVPSKYQHEAGGLSGKPLLELSSQVLKSFRQVLGDGYPIIGVGGVDSEAALKYKLDAGANLVQVYTGFIYQGPKLVLRLINYLKNVGTDFA